MSDSPTLEIAAKAKALVRDGVDIISFSAGQPDFPTPAHISAAGIEAIEKGMTGYTASPGTPDLRAAVARWMTHEVGIEYSSANVLVSSGAKYAIALSILATIDPGDEVIFAAPFWVSYPEMVRLADGVPVIVKTSPESGFKMSAAGLQSAITDKTRMVLLNSPSNPSGSVYSEAELAALAEVLEDRPDIWVLSDEIYSRLVFDGETHVSIARISPGIAARTIVINGISKTFSMTGWRVGWVAAPKELIRKIGMIQSHTVSCASSISQYAAQVALESPDDFLDGFIDEYTKRRDLFIELLGGIPGIKVFPPKGAFYLFCDIGGWLDKRRPDGEELETCSRAAEFLLDEAGVAVVPGVAFGMDSYLRFSFATSKDNIKRGVERIARAVEKLR